MSCAPARTALLPLRSIHSSPVAYTFTFNLHIGRQQQAAAMSSPTQPIQIQFSPPPAFELSSTSSLAAPDPTNTLALLLPHPFLFHPPILALLRAHYASYGNLHTWAPIRAFGRVILVYYTDDDAMRAKREGDRLEVGGNADRVAGGGYFPMPASSEAAGTQDESMRDYQRNQEDKGLHEKERNPR